MKLIVTLGSTKTNRTHTYKIEGKEYNEYFSFMALKRHFNIESKNISIIGTKKTFDELGDLIKDLAPNYKPIKVNENDIKNVFEKANNCISQGAILDVTQSFKTLSFGVLMAYSLSKNLNRSIKDIYYAQVQNNCNPSRDSCYFIFQSLKKYDEIIDLTREINMFVQSWQAIKYVEEKQDESISIMHDGFVRLVDKILITDLDIKNELKEIKKGMSEIKLQNQLDFLQNYLIQLKKEIEKIENALIGPEYKKLLNFSKMYYEKNLLLQSITTLFESMQSYLEKIIKEGATIKCRRATIEKTNGRFYKVPLNEEPDTYHLRNCLKNKLINDDLDNLTILSNKHLRKMKEIIKDIDKKRNASAHAFISDKMSIQELKNTINTHRRDFEDIVNSYQL